MGAFFNILLHSIGSLFIGLLITILAMALMLFIIKSWYKTREYTALSFIVGGIFFLILSYHAVIICGAITIKGYGDDVEYCINSLVDDLPDGYVFTQSETQQVLNRLSDQLPLVGYYANMADFSGHTPLDLAESMNNKLQSFMNEYIVEHLLWILGFTILGAFCIIKTMERSKTGKRYSAHHSKTKFYDE